MDEKEYEKVELFMGVLSSKGFPLALRKTLEENFGEIAIITEPIPFTFTNYYDEEMGLPIERFFILFKNLVRPDFLVKSKKITNEIEKRWEEDGKRKINLDPGTLSEANVILATTKNRAHRVAIGNNLFAEITLIYQNHVFTSFPWTYSDYKSEEVQNVLFAFRQHLLKKRKEEKSKA